MVKFIKGYIVWITSLCIFYLLLFGSWVLLDKGHEVLAALLFACIHDYFFHFKVGFATFFSEAPNE